MYVLVVDMVHYVALSAVGDKGMVIMARTYRTGPKPRWGGQ